MPDPASPSAAAADEETAQLQSRIFRSPGAGSPWMSFYFPAAWRVEPQRNVLAGVMAAVVTLPLAMGLGALAVAPFGPAFVSLGVVAGLYSAAFLSLITFFAGARGVAIYAPRSLVSFVIASVAGGLLVGAAWLPADDPPVVMSALFLLMAMAGAFQLVFALARLPRLMKFMPTPVMAGFQNAAAITIAMSQLHVFVGLQKRPALDGLAAALAEMKPLQLAVGVATFALVFHGQKVVKRVPALLTALVAGTLLYYLLVGLGLSAYLGDTLGHIPLRIPDGSELRAIAALTERPGFAEALPAMVVAAGSIAVVASLDVLISAKVVENLSGRRGNATRELTAMGLANTATALLGGIAGSISLSSTTANVRSGARNALSLLTHGVLFLLIMTLLAPLLGFIPKVVIAALVLFAGTQLFDRWTFQLVKRMARGKSVNWRNIAIDLVVIVLVTSVALMGQIIAAVGAGIAIAILVFTMRMSRGMIRSTRTAEELRSRRTRRSSELEALAANGRSILVIELEGPLFFASAEQLHNRIDIAMAENVRYVILDVSRVNEIDSTGGQILVQTWSRMKAAGIELAMCGQDDRPKTAALLRDHGVAEAVGKERFFPDSDRALEWCENSLLARLESRLAAEPEHEFERFDIVQGLEPEERSILLPLLARREFATGSTIFSQGDEGDALYIIVRGSASVRMKLPTGDRRLVTFSSGTVFGEMALVDRQRRSATVTADEPLSCYVFQLASWDGLAQSQPRIAMKLLANLARAMSLRIRQANRSLFDG
ncbi:MAG: SLC26A/SulP transporter family protein [Burkholderiales bacterium]|nr:SLC26A/SulP transporter family protein [Burkholderiales bacterium]